MGEVSGLEVVPQIGRDPGGVAHDQPGKQGARIRGEASARRAQPAAIRRARRWIPVGGPVIRGGCAPGTLNTAAMRSPSVSGGSTRAVSRNRVVGSSRFHPAEWAITSTGVRTAAVVPSGRVTRSLRRQARPNRASHGRRGPGDVIG